MNNSQEAQALITQFLNHNISRRDFLRAFTVSIASLSLTNTLGCFYQISNKESALNSNEDRIIEHLQNHLFPNYNNSPSAKDVNSLAYLHFVLLDEEIDIRDRKFIKNGITWLEEEAISKYSKSFVDLTEEEKELLLKGIIEKNWGERFISNVLSYIFEALLSDPIYGGNQKNIGWKWLEHNPGFPRPNEENSYQKLILKRI